MWPAVWLLLAAPSLLSGTVAEAGTTYATHILEHVRPQAPAEVQRKAALEVIERTIGPEQAGHFTVQINGSLERNSFHIVKESAATPVQITASSGVAATKAFYHYLKYCCHCLVVWEGSQLELPSPLPTVNVTVIAPSSFVYYQNVCTWSYSFTWWRWSQWRAHIDWMALQGITLSLAPFQEDVWTELYLEYNLTLPQIENHLAGPGFFAWQRMGNVRGWGGPLTKSFAQFSSTLQQRIVKEMRRLGMVLALPAFAGHLPVPFRTLYPNHNFTDVPVWNHFPPQYASPLFLDPTERLFGELGARFLERMIERYGTDHLYFADPFNEIDPASAAGRYLQSVASSIYGAMVTVDPAAVWLLQGWMFVKNPFWSDRAIRSFLTAVPIGRLLVLDLQSEQFPQYGRTDSYAGQPFIWCMLSNFGGTLGMLGSVENVYRGVREARAGGNRSYTMLGTGITPEGINQNYGVYEFALEMGWYGGAASIPGTEQWFSEYAVARYGAGATGTAGQRAWDVFRRTVYNYVGLERMHGKYTFNRRPSTKISPWVWYNETTFNEGLQLLLTFADTTGSCNALCRYDVVDVTRQFAQNVADRLYLTLMDDYKRRRYAEFRQHATQFLALLAELDQLLLTEEAFLLGRWLAAARSFGETPLERQKYEYNARIQLTLWGPQGQIVDYANKQWAGMVADFFLPRWQLFLGELDLALATNGTISDTKLRDQVFRNVELPFTTDTKRYATVVSGEDPVRLARSFYAKWSGSVTGLRELPTVAPHRLRRTKPRSHWFS
ncbi:alpha-N-acetylglucosaminidase-like [Anopheles albimanus]|uniref:alpha-N-acetylglucosaminidase-like n=1 Tax=Anopheles albimanus TaxID=7167 RepID=UPI0016400328|nr:alpha-N-acetylglucosaminidase-like [Anopheles albimanus]